MVGKVNEATGTGAAQTDQAANSAKPTPDADRAKKFSGTLAAWMSRASGIKPNYAGQDEDDADPEPIKMSAPIIAPDVSKKAKAPKAATAPAAAGTPTGTSAPKAT